MNQILLFDKTCGESYCQESCNSCLSTHHESGTHVCTCFCDCFAISATSEDAQEGEEAVKWRVPSIPSSTTHRNAHANLHGWLLQYACGTNARGLQAWTPPSPFPVLFQISHVCICTAACKTYAKQGDLAMHKFDLMQHRISDKFCCLQCKLPYCCVRTAQVGSCL